MKNIGTVKDLKKGSYVLIDDIPCKVTDIAVSKPGKHGAAKAKVTAVGIIRGEKKTLMKPVDADVDIPIVLKRTGQIVADMGSKYQIMDMENYQTFEIDKTPGMVEGQAGQEVDYMEVMGKKYIRQIKGMMG